MSARRRTRSSLRSVGSEECLVRDPAPSHDLRLVPVAAAGWAGAWLGTGLTGPDRWSLVAVGSVLVTVAILCLIAAPLAGRGGGRRRSGARRHSRRRCSGRPTGDERTGRRSGRWPGRGDGGRRGPQRPAGADRTVRWLRDRTGAARRDLRPRAGLGGPVAGVADHRRRPGGGFLAAGAGRQHGTGVGPAGAGGAGIRRGRGAASPAGCRRACAPRSVAAAGGAGPRGVARGGGRTSGRASGPGAGAGAGRHLRHDRRSAAELPGHRVWRT